MNKTDDRLEFERPVLLVGSADFDIGLFRKLADQGYAIIAADGGANQLYHANIKPDAIIGDLDSLENPERFGPDTRILHFDEQETTDFEKCLYCVRAPIFLAMGFTGKRLDHTLSNMHTIAKYHETKNVVLIAGDDVSFVWRGEFSSPVSKRTTVSIFPLMPITFSHSLGLLFDLKHLTMEIGQFVGTSNRTIDNEFSIFPTPGHDATPYLITLSGGTVYELVELCLQNPSRSTI